MGEKKTKSSWEAVKLEGRLLRPEDDLWPDLENLLPGLVGRLVGADGKWGEGVAWGEWGEWEEWAKWAEWGECRAWVEWEEGCGRWGA